MIPEAKFLELPEDEKKVGLLLYLTMPAADIGSSGTRTNMK